ncbi:MAG TPA: hypothetical protein VF600_01075 [Abditibacteriaceae bacterium]|jgi:hypothetical protein
MSHSFPDRKHFSIKRSATKRYARRRSGQALLLAVLLMVFAALLGTTFMTVVSLNLNQTARSSDKAAARLAAEAGLQFTRRQLQEKGLSWRPKSEAAPPQPRDADYRFYYDDYDLSQGWATTGVADTPTTRDDYNRDGFVRYPDPRALSSAPKDPLFMVKVETVRNGDWDNARRDKTSDLRITVIGRSVDNPAAFERRIAYQSGVAHNPLFAAMRSVTNWDFGQKAVPVAQVAASPPPTSTQFSLEAPPGASLLSATNPVFPLTLTSGPFYILIGDPKSGRVRGAVVESYAFDTSVTPPRNVMKLSLALGAAPAAGERVEMAGALGAPSFLDYDGSGGPFDAAKERIDFWLSADTSTSASAGGVRVNGSLLWYGDVKAAGLRSPQSATYGQSATDTVPGAIKASGLMQIMQETTTPASTPQVAITGQYFNGRSNQNTPANTTLDSSSAERTFPGNWSGMTAGEKAQLVDDGWNRLQGEETAQTRNVQPFTPPDITSDQQGLSRYRNLSKYSQPAKSSDGPSAALHGYGQGIYLDNTTDRERVYDGTKNFLREMNQAELRQLWLAASGPDFSRGGSAQAITSPTASLEQQHLRGWVGSDEFRARGALVELNGNTLSITREMRDDNTATDTTRSQGPVPSKGWKDAGGKLLGDSSVAGPSLGGVYRQTLPWPQNGILFAEGNIRIKGVAANARRSLTVVSMNNIYIEGSLVAGSLGAGNRKILLLARKNVILNPTAVVSRVEAQTRLRSGAASGARTLSVYDAGGFRAGDWITFDAGTIAEHSVCVESVSLGSNNNDSITLRNDTPLRSPQSTNAVVSAQGDPHGAIVETQMSRIGLAPSGLPQVLQRRVDVNLPSVSSGVRLALRHGGERREAFRVSVEPGTMGSSPTNAWLSHKLASDAETTVVQSAQKQLQVQYGTTPTEVDVFPQPAPSTNAAAAAYKLLFAPGDIDPTANLRNNIEQRRADPLLWHYSVSFPPRPNPPIGLGSYEQPSPRPPFYFLAALGNRLGSAGGAFPWRDDIAPPVGGGPSPGYALPMATSVVARVNGDTSVLRSDRYNPSLGTSSGYEEVGQLGISAVHGVTSTPTSEGWEDVLTSDQSFYNGTASWLDNRTLYGLVNNSQNTIALKINDLVAPYFSGVSDPFLPRYHLSRLKLEDVGQNANHEFESLQPSQTLDVRAFVYAQEGSWIVLPGDYFDASVRNGVDVDRNGIITRAEQVAGYRFRRYNTRISFTGAIMENRTEIVANSGAVPGAVADWMDKWATVRIDSGNWSGADAGATFNNDLRYDSSNPGTNDFPNISYTYDDEVVKGLYEDDAGLQVPFEVKLYYQG